MINNSLEELFNSIENSSLYQEYKKMSNILSQDKHIKEIIEEIKELEKEATYLESIGDLRFHDIDNQIKEKAQILNDNPIYQEYLNRMDDFNEELSTSSKMIEKYVEEVV